MRETTLPSPGPLAMMGHQLRRQAALAISGVETRSRHTVTGKSKAANQLKAFFDACSTALASYIDTTLPTVVSRIRTAANTVTITCSEQLNASDSVPLTAFVFSPARTVTAIHVTGTTIVITATGAVAGDTVAYTAPAVNPVVDVAKNALATFTAAAVA